MAERETKNVATSFGSKLIIKTYLTAREQRAIQNVYLENAEIDELGHPKIKANSADIVNQAEDALLSQYVVSLNDDSQNLLNRLLDLPNKEMDEIKKIIEETRIVDDKKKV